MEREQRITLCVNDYETEKEFWNEVASLMAILMRKGKYECVLRYADCGVYVIEYCYSRYLGYGSPFAVWLTEEEYESVELEEEEEE